jgi:hypothetical protein
MRSFDQLLGLLSNIPDPRRAEGKEAADIRVQRHPMPAQLVRIKPLVR